MASSSSSAADQAPDRGKKRSVPREECQICCEEYSSRNYAIECPFVCSSGSGSAFKSCLACMKRYILESSQLPHCMQCRRTYTLYFIEQEFTPAALKEVQAHRKQILLLQDQAFLPEAQVELLRQKEDARRQKMIRDAQRAVDAMAYEYRQWTGTQRRSGGPKSAAIKADAPINCPAPNCHGFMVLVADDDVYSATNESKKQRQQHPMAKCPLCETCMCMTCRSVVGPQGPDVPPDGPLGPLGHECDPSNVQTVAEMLRSTRPCPECHVRTQKSDGCDQMFCTNCHTAWNWRTGQKERGVVHNPHFFEWQRQQRAANGQGQGREPVVPGCGQLPNLVPYYLATRYPFLDMALRAVFHIRATRINGACGRRRRPTAGHGRPRAPDNLDIRIQWLESKLTEDQYRTRVAARNVKYLKEQAYFDAHQMFVTVATDILLRIFARRTLGVTTVDLTGDSTTQPVEATLLGELAELEALRTYYNDTLIKIHERHRDHCGTWFQLITEKWDCVSYDKFHQDRQI